jgi:hypothetical protein
MTNQPNSQFAEFDELLSRYVEGTASAEEVSQLEARLVADEGFADHFSRWCLMHRQIGELMTEDALHEMMDRYVQGTPGPPRGVFAAEAGAGSLNSAAERSAWHRPRRLLALAASIIAVVGASLWGAGVFSTDQNQAITATLTRLADAEWAKGADRFQPGDHLAIGDSLALARGMAKVTFECGAEVVLEGPCNFEVRSAMLGYLASGKITADVPHRAFGFAILSPEVDFVDLGTSFGVSVGDNGRTELHVFDGEVLCSKPSEPAGTPSEAFHVLANRAVEFTSGGGAPSDIVMDTEPFSDMIALRRPNKADAKRVAPDRLALWLAADAAIATDAAGKVISWQDILHGDNQSAEDAVQGAPLARPTLVKNGLHGKPTVRFDGEADFLLTTPLETTDNQTVILVSQFSQSALAAGRRWGGQILNYDGPPSRYLSNLLEPGVLQIGEPLLESEFKPTLLTSQVFAGFIGSATVEVGRVDAKPVGVDAPFVLAYTYNYTDRVAEMQINGRSYGTGRAYAPQGITSRKIIGRHAWMQNFFHGDLSELLIYNRALRPDELASTMSYLAEKYAITLEDAE